MAWIEQTSFLSEIFGEFSYLAPFVVLLLCGIGLPLPEEVTLIGSGILYHRGDVEFVPIVLVCSTAILLGDSIPYWLGRRYGMNALEIRWVARILHPERFAKLRRRFEEHGNWATFAARFFAGVRIPGYFLAGTMGMPYLRFLLLDAIGVALSVPISIYLGKLFGNKIDELESRMQDLHMLFAFVALSLVLILIVKARRQRARNGSGAAVAPSTSAATSEPARSVEVEPPGGEPTGPTGESSYQAGDDPLPPPAR